MDAPPPLIPPDLPRLSGSEKFSEGESSVLEFWRWAMGDLRMNNARGILVEYLVAQAVGATDPMRVEWDACDVRTPDGTRIEVKSSAYLQSWAQKTPSKPRFGLSGAAAAWDPATGESVDHVDGRVDVWVFALHSCKDHATYNPLDVSQWQFWVAPDHAVAASGQRSGGLAFVQRIAGESMGWADLRAAIAKAAEAKRQRPAS